MDVWVKKDLDKYASERNFNSRHITKLYLYSVNTNHHQIYDLNFHLIEDYISEFIAHKPNHIYTDLFVASKRDNSITAASRTSSTATRS